MADQSHLDIIIERSVNASNSQSVKAWNSWRERNPSIEPDLSRANLSEADLLRANLSRADLSRADLSGANLSGANLRYCILIRANFQESTLTDCSIYGI